MHCNVAIKIEELPARLEKLSTSQTQKVFGGCNREGEDCEKSSDCCGELNYYIYWSLPESNCAK